MTPLSSQVSEGLWNLQELIPGDDAVVVEINPPESQLYPVQLVRVDRGLFAAAEESLAGLEMEY